METSSRNSEDEVEEEQQTQLTSAQKKEILAHQLYQNEITTAIYYLPAMFIGLWYIFGNGVDGYRKTNYFDILVCANLFGFTIYDTIFSLYHGTMEPMMALHHLATFINLYNSIVFTYGGNMTVFVVFWTQFTDLIYTIRFMFHKYKVEKKSKAYTYLLIVQVIVYVSRTFSVWYIVWISLVNTKIPLYHVTFTSFITFVSVVWSIKMIVGVWQALPYCFDDPKTLENQSWWRTIRDNSYKYTATKPYKDMMTGALVFLLLVVPTAQAYFYRP